MTKPALSPQEAWDPLPPGEWDAAAVRHLLRRAGWTALPPEVVRAQREGLEATLDRLFPASPRLLPKPPQVAGLEDGREEEAGRIARAAPGERRGLERAAREKSRAAMIDLSLRWLEFAARPECSAYQKWALFLGDIYVVSFEKVARADLLFGHFDLLARLGMGPAPSLTKAVSRSPAMVAYLDLNQSRRGAPNENFARELFELFVLGEGHYTERDVKEAARAFTGYRLRPPGRSFAFAPRQHDDGVKTVLGLSGRLSGDDVIDQAYRQPAAGAFLPHEWVKFYLSDTMLPAEHLDRIGGLWRAQGYSLRWLALRLFGSRLFFAPEFRGEFIKSPLQVYLGLVQDLGLNVMPVARQVLNPLRQMGQVLFVPPNVRGWVGGRAWINSTSLSARRNSVEMLFTPLREGSLNQEEIAALGEARAAGAGNFDVPDSRLAPLAGMDPAAAAARMAETLLAGPADPAFVGTIAGYLAGAGGRAPERLRRTRRALITVLQSAEYQLS